MSDRRLSIHPLAIATACDGYTSRVMGSTKKPVNVPTFGLLFGTQDEENGKTVIFDVCECDLNYIAEEGIIEPIMESLVEGKRLTQIISPHYQCLGWYISGKDVTVNHNRCHLQLSEMRDNDQVPLLDDSILFFITPDKSQDEVPFDLHVFDNQAGVFLAVDKFTLEASPVEQASMDAVMKSETHASTMMLQNNTSFITAIGKLEKNIDTVSASIKNYIANKPLDRDVVRRTAKICSLLDRAKGNSQTLDDLLIDTTLISLLSASTKTNTDIKTLLDAYASSSSQSNKHHRL